MSGRTLSALDQRVLRGDVPQTGRDRLRYATGIFSPRLLLNVNEITTKIKGIGSIVPITEARSGRGSLCWNKDLVILKI